MQNGFTVVAGLIFFIIVVVGIGYYLIYYVPYTIKINEYNIAYEEYVQKSKACLAGDTKVQEPVECNSFLGECDQAIETGRVAGCSDVPAPEKPHLPLESLIQTIGSVMNWDITGGSPTIFNQ